MLLNRNEFAVVNNPVRPIVLRGLMALARARFAHARARVRLWVGDATTIAAPDGYYDAVFVFGVVHHVPDRHEQGSQGSAEVPCQMW